MICVINPIPTFQTKFCHNLSLSHVNFICTYTGAIIAQNKYIIKKNILI